MLDALKVAVLNAIYPPRCLACTESTAAPHGLCPACWRDTTFLSGALCACCGAPLIGEAEPGDRCEGCLRHPPAWDRGRAAMLYAGAGRRIVLGLKHGDRLDLVPPLAGWMVNAGRELIAEADLIAPVPLYWRRLIKRRYNQSGELGRRIAQRGRRPFAADLLTRARATRPQEGMDRATRQANQTGAFRVTPRHAPRVAGGAVLLIDDVMTSGATLSACAETCRAAGARRVDVLVLARVAFADGFAI